MNQITLWQRLFFPAEVRKFPGLRWVNICMRSIHLIGVAGIGGGFIFELETTQWQTFWHLALVSGVLLTLLYIWQSGMWLLQLKGQVIICKLLLLGLALALPEWRTELFIMVIIFSSIIAHAPGNVRGFLLFSRRNL